MLQRKDKMTVFKFLSLRYGLVRIISVRHETKQICFVGCQDCVPTDMFNREVYFVYFNDNYYIDIYIK